jgi:4-hydroxy-tetrahydrodipicolinate reductase
MTKMKIAVCGAAGRMGSSIIRLAKQDETLEVTGAVESKDYPDLGKGSPALTSDTAGALKNCDVLIDFTIASATLEHLGQAVTAGKAIVIGTTGIDKEGIKKIEEAAKKIPVFFTPNMSIGVNVLFKVVSDIAKMVPGYDVEIVELHHNQKKDSPSGTALKLFQVIAKALGRNPDEVGVFGRHGIIGARKKEEIGVHAVRGGDIVGDHTVYFIGPGERIEVTHRAHSRDTLAAGSLVAAKWLKGKAPGLYNMQDVLKSVSSI